MNAKQPPLKEAAFAVVEYCDETLPDQWDANDIAAIIKRELEKAVPALTDGQIEQIEEKAHLAFRQRCRGIRGQMVTPADASDYWLVVITANECRKAFLGESE